MDRVTADARSEIMRHIKSGDSKAEMKVRRLVFGMGYRYRLHVRSLPGVPDLVFWGRRKIILVHGCFWHLHGRCQNARMPKSNVGYWDQKLRGNKARDDRNLLKLQSEGWEVLTLWECELKDMHSLAERVRAFLGEAGLRG